ncbi:MAG: hypothetical protein V3S01_08295, partial [Dehalococcoidia bacterium]
PAYWLSCSLSAMSRLLLRQGAAGQEAGPPGLGPEPQVVHQPGGQLLNKIQDPAFDTVEYLFRALPEDSWFSPTTSTKRPIKFEFGVFTVPKSQYFLVTDYEFVALRQSGVDPFDFMEAAPYRFSGFMGFDITLDGRRVSNLFYQLDPAPVQFFRQAFAPSFGAAPAPTASFNQAAANSFGAVAGEGTSLLPVRPNVQGSRNMPFTMIAEPGTKVSLSCVIFRRVTAPLAGLQASVSGYSIHSNTMSALLNRMRPR